MSSTAPTDNSDCNQELVLLLASQWNRWSHWEPKLLRKLLQAESRLPASCSRIGECGNTALAALVLLGRNNYGFYSNLLHGRLQCGHLRSAVVFRSRFALPCGVSLWLAQLCWASALAHAHLYLAVPHLTVQPVVHLPGWRLGHTQHSTHGSQFEDTLPGDAEVGQVAVDRFGIPCRVS